MRSTAILFGFSLALIGAAGATQAQEQAKTKGQDQAQGLIASYAENSGSLPPIYAWHYSVEFAEGGAVTTRYCKGYGDTAPDCATQNDTLPPGQLAALLSALAPIAADLAAHPIAEMTEPPVGGGSTTAQIFGSAGAALPLPPFPVDTDAQRAAAALDVLRAFTPLGAIDAAKSRAVQPN